jgi:hypothetical protein
MYLIAAIAIGIGIVYNILPEINTNSPNLENEIKMSRELQSIIADLSFASDIELAEAYDRAIEWILDTDENGGLLNAMKTAKSAMARVIGQEKRLITTVDGMVRPLIEYYEGQRSLTNRMFVRETPVPHLLQSIVDDALCVSAEMNGARVAIDSVEKILHEMRTNNPRLISDLESTRPGFISWLFQWVNSHKETLALVIVFSLRVVSWLFQSGNSFFLSL